MNRTTYGLDIAKNVMQLHWVDTETGEIGRKKLARAKLSEFFARLQPVRVVMEACGSAHHWARVLGALGHQIELLPARQVRPFVRSNKDDAADARAIWVAAQQSDIRRVPLKSVAQQAALALHRSRQHWVSAPIQI
jgi:transposase